MILNNSWESAENGISVNPAPLPLNTEADTPILNLALPLTDKLPLNVEPLATELTTNPKLGETDAVTLPLKIFDVSKSEIAATGISNKFLPLPE